MNTGNKGIELIKSFEGCMLKAYKCSANKTTIGYGNTFYEDGTPVKFEDEITKERAEEHFMNFAPMFEIGNEIEFTTSEANRLRLKYPKITVAPMFYNVDDNKIYLIDE